MRAGFTPIEELDRPSATDAAAPMEAPRSGFVPAAQDQAMPRRMGFTPVAELSTPPQPKLSPQQKRTEALRMAKDEALNSPPVALAETAANLLSQSVAIPVSGLAGLATEAGRALGLTQREGADVVREVGEALTYQPRGAAGQKAVEVITWPFQKLAEGGEAVGKRVLDATGSPGAATAVDVAINMLPAAVVPAWKATKQTLGERGAAQGSTPQSPPNAIGQAAHAPAVKPARSGFTPLESSDAQPIAASPNTTPDLPTRAQRLANDAQAMPGSEAQGLPEVRGRRDSGVPAVGEFSGLPERPGAGAEPAALAGAPGREGPLRAGELSVDAASRAGEAPGLLQAGELARAGDDGGRSRAPAGAAEPQYGAAPPGPRTPAGEPAQRQAVSGLDVADPPGPDASPARVGPAGQAARTGAVEADPAGLAGGAGPEPAAAPAPRAARYALIEADDLKASHDANLRQTPGYPETFMREGWTWAEAEQRVQAITRDLDPARLMRALDDAEGAPVVAPDGVVEAGNARAIALQRIYQASGHKADAYRAHLIEQAQRLGLDPATVATMEKPVLVRLPDEQAPRHAVSPPEVKAAGATWAPGANYVGAVDEAKLPNADGARTWTGERAKPIRREEIIEPFANALQTAVYEGRMPSRMRKNVLGFFRPRTEEVRIKRRADLETTAHELAHLLEQRFPEVTNSWGTGRPGWQVRRAELKGLSYDSRKIDEGFAEFVRHWMTQPEVAATRAPEFSKWFEDFVQRNPHREAIQQARDGMQAWFNQDAIDRARSKIGKPLHDAAHSRWDAFRQAALDDLHGVYRMERELNLGKIAPAGPYESARLTRAAASMADGAIRFGAPVRKPDGSYTFQGRGLQDILKPVADNLEDALLYFVGRSSRELLAQGREHLFTGAEIDAMLKLRTPEREQAFRDYQKWNSAILDFAQDHGVINSQARQMWQRTAYLPFHRVGQPDGFKGKPGDWSGVKALTGGTENLRDVLGNITANAAMLIDKAVKNEARAKIAALAEDPGRGGGRFMVKIEPESRPVKVSTEATVEAIIKGMGLDAKSPEAQTVRDMLASAPNMLEVLQGNMPPAGGNVVAVLKDGKPTWYEVADPLLLRALESIDRQHLPTFMRWLTLPKRITQAAITLTPDFMAANLARDTIMASVMTRSGFKPFLDSARGMRLRLTEDPLYRDFIANGGGLSSMYLDESRLRADLGRFYQRQGIDVRTVLNTPAKLLGFMEKALDAVESSSRLGEYRRAIEAGEHPRHAAYRGREVSVDFAMRGDSMAVNAYADTVVFLRAAMTSWDRMYRGLAHDPNRAQIMGKAGMLGAASVALYLANREDPRYQALPDWDRDAHWHFFIGGEHFRYPKVFEVGAVASTAERTVEALLQDDPQGLGKDVARIFATAFGVNLIPQAVAPLAEQAANKNFFTGAPIETPGMEDVQPFLRAKATTSETLRAAGMATATLPEGLQVNPVRAEALVRGYLATWGMYGLALADEAFFPDTKPAMRTDQLPVVRRFYSQEPQLRTRYEDEFYKALDEASRLRGTLRELDRQGHKHLADEKERAPMAGEALPLQRAAQGLAEVNAQMRQVRRDDALSPADKRVQLDALIAQRNDLLRRTVQAHEASIKLKKESPP